MLSTVVTSVVLLNNTVKDSCPYGAHAFWDHICATAPCLTSRAVFSVSPWRPHNPHNLNTSELEFIVKGTKNSLPLQIWLHSPTTVLPNVMILSFPFIFCQFCFRLSPTCLSYSAFLILCPQAAHHLSPKPVQRPLTWPVCLWSLSSSLCSFLIIIAKFNFY